MRYPYRRRKEPAGDAFAAFRINRKMTRHASEVSTTLAVRLGSFRETRETLRLLGGGTVSTSKIRDETLCVGGQALEGLKKPAADVRVYTVAAMNAPEDGKRVERTLVAMADGTNVHCVKKDTAGIEGRNGGEAGSRQIRVMTFAEYCAVDGKGAPRRSFSYAVTDGGVEELTGLLRRHGIARGSGTPPPHAVRGRRGGRAPEGIRRRLPGCGVHKRCHARLLPPPRMQPLARHREPGRGVRNVQTHHVQTRGGGGGRPDQKAVCKGT